MRILMALSGGIDSSVVAHLLQQEGHELVGVRFTLWSDPLAPAMATVLPSKCCNTQTAARAREVAKDLGIPYHIVDLEKEFYAQVVQPFLEGYRAGLTPNPCIGCNRTIKFGKLVEIADEFGCEKVATGHYARIRKHGQQYELLEAIDTKKDQSYFLYGLTQEQLSRALFPLGEMQKSEVYDLAEKFHVPHDEYYRESQDLCFFPEKTPEKFLERHLQDVIRPGDIVKTDGTKVGIHKGLPLYTLGQRRGLGVGGLKIPLEVVSKNSADNTLIVADRDAVKGTKISLTDIHWIGPKPSPSIDLEVRTRSLAKRQSGHLIWNGSSGTFTFAEGQHPLAPGQSLVFYTDDVVIGGGVMGSLS